MKLRKEKFFFLGYDKETALTAAIILSFVLVFILLSSSIYAISIDSKNMRITELISIKSVISLLLNTLLFYFLFRFQFWAITRYANHPYKMWIMLVLLFLIVAIFSPVLSKMQWWWYRGRVSGKVYSTLHYVKDVTILIISFLFTALIYLINQNQKSVTENQNLVIENLRNRYNALKNQTDPHFLFNSLNTLNGLIGYDDERAHEYVEQLSAVFRYTMQDRTVTRVSEELQFIDSYVYLMKIRYNDGLSVECNIDDNHKDYFIVPFGLQLLIENAVKHNVVSRKNPLRIVVKSTPDETIRVENNLQPKQSVQDSRGIGLTNLNECYRLMFGKEIVVQADEECFSVEIPLIKSIDKDKLINVPV